MAGLTGFDKVAVVGFNGNNSPYYHFALYEDVVAGDKVLISGTGYGQIATVIEVITAEEAKERCNKNITAEVICKVDTAAYDERVRKRKEAEQLKKDMDKVIKLMDEASKYDMYADRNPELAAMLKRYKELTGCAKQNG